MEKKESLSGIVVEVDDNCWDQLLSVDEKAGCSCYAVLEGNVRRHFDGTKIDYPLQLSLVGSYRACQEAYETITEQLQCKLQQSSTSTSEENVMTLVIGWIDWSKLLVVKGECVTLAQLKSQLRKEEVELRLPPEIYLVGKEDASIQKAKDHVTKYLKEIGDRPKLHKKDRLTLKPYQCGLFVPQSTGAQSCYDDMVAHCEDYYCVKIKPELSICVVGTPDNVDQVIKEFKEVMLHTRFVGQPPTCSAVQHKEIASKHSSLCRILHYTDGTAFHYTCKQCQKEEDERREEVQRLRATANSLLMKHEEHFGKFDLQKSVDNVFTYKIDDVVRDLDRKFQREARHFLCKIAQAMYTYITKMVQDNLPLIQVGLYTPPGDPTWKQLGWRMKETNLEEVKLAYTSLLVAANFTRECPIPLTKLQLEREVAHSMSHLRSMCLSDQQMEEFQKAALSLMWKFVTSSLPIVVTMPNRYSPMLHEEIDILPSKYELQYSCPVVFASCMGKVAVKGRVKATEASGAIAEASRVHETSVEAGGALTLDNIMAELEDVATDWYTLGKCLGVPTQALDKMGKPFEKRMSQLMRWWLHHSEHAEWKSLVKVLEDLEEYSAAGNIRDRYIVSGTSKKVTKTKTHVFPKHMKTDIIV